MKKIILLLLTFLAFTSNIYASTKKVDPWKYEPQRRAGTNILDLVAERTVEKSILDQVIDNTTLQDVITETEKRKASVQATSATAKKAMGNTMMKRIFQNTLKGGVWGALGVSALQSLLEGIDWVMDPKSQSIWRYKNSDGLSCTGSEEYVFRWQENKYSKCPIDAVNATLNAVNGPGKPLYEFVSWDVPDLIAAAKSGLQIKFTVKSTYAGSTQLYPNQTLQAMKNPDYVPEKETLTDEQLADYMLGQHPDFNKQKYKPKLPAPQTWTSVAEAFKPANDYEYENSPAVQLAKHAIDNGTTIRDESDTKTDVTTKPDGSGFNLPEFCTWAKYVCDFVDWYKEAPEKENEQPDQDIDDKGIFSRKFDTVFTLSKDCPPDIPFNLDAYYFQGSYTISLRWLCIIFTALGYPLMFVAHCTGIWILYEAVIRKEIRAN
ncbi:hypothetical protein [Acinetobacter seifertii]|uniref:hypothetical protein n=1 Tax=Acinetobacter seifertii TaxID=1530123 RepID=UPI00124FA30A|nr:hypothetical protein [Acinetobacter seifertii]